MMLTVAPPTTTGMVEANGLAKVTTPELNCAEPLPPTVICPPVKLAPGAKIMLPPGVLNLCVTAEADELSVKLPVVLVMLSASTGASVMVGANVVSNVRSMVWPAAVTPSPSDRLMDWPTITTLPTEVIALVALVPPPSFTFKSTLLAAVSLMAPLVSVFRLVVDLTKMSRPAVTLMPACVASRPVLVALTSPLSATSLEAPLVVSVVTPLPLVNAPRVMAPFDAAVMLVPAIKALAAMEPLAL